MVEHRRVSLWKKKHYEAKGVNIYRGKNKSRIKNQKSFEEGVN